MSQTATKDDLKELKTGLKDDLKELKTELKEDVQKLGENLRDEIRENTRDIISHFNASQGEQNKELKAMHADIFELKEDVSKIKLAVVDLMATDRHMHNLVAALQRNGIALNEAEIFTS